MHLKYQAPPIDDTGDRLALEDIVITEEMLEAGFAVLRASGIAEDYSGADRLLVGDIFRAMASRRHPT